MRKVEAAINIYQPAVKIFDAFTEQSLLKEWWGVERSLIDKKQGGIYSLAWGITEKGFQYISTGVFTIYHHGRELMVDNFVYFNPEKEILGPTWLRVKLNAHREYTEVLVTQGGYQDGGDWDWFYDSVKDAWPKVLKSLKSFIDV